MAADSSLRWQHQLDFKLYNLVPTTVRIDFPAIEGTDMTSGLPMIQIGACYTDSPLSISNLQLHPRRIQFEIASAPALLPVSLKIRCPGPFVYGWLLVPASVQTVIATVVEQIRFVGPGYWALPLLSEDEAADAAPRSTAPGPPFNSAATKPAEKLPESRPAPAKTATGATAS